MPTNKSLIGWREWASLPDLKIPLLKAKIDTGARSSALHTFALDTFTRDGREWAKFKLHPLQNREDITIEAEAPIIDQRLVTDSGGHQEYRYFIQTNLRLLNQTFAAEISLTTRDTMRFRMLIGRTALNGRFTVDPEQSYLSGEHSKSSVLKMYRS